jgi:hypothetical protein
MHNRAIKLLEEKIYLVKKLILNTNEISEENKFKRISELEELEMEIKELKSNMNYSKDANMVDVDIDVDKY